MNKSFLWIKSHVAESQVASLVWPCLSLKEKQCAVNHMISYNDSVSKFYQCSIRNSPRQSANAGAYIYIFLVSASAKEKSKKMLR